MCTRKKNASTLTLAEHTQSGAIDDDDFVHGADSLASEVLVANDEKGEEDKDEDEDDDRCA